MKKVLVFPLILIFFFTACAGLKIKPWAERSPAEKSLAFMQFFNRQFEDTMSMAKDPKSTLAQKQMVMKKKEILRKLYPLIWSYDNLVVMGQIPPQLTEDAILAFINQLGGVL